MKNADSARAGAVTAISIANAATTIAKAFGIDHLIAAEPELTADGEITGRLLGTPPYGPGKVVNMHAWLASLGWNILVHGVDFAAAYYALFVQDLP